MSFLLQRLDVHIPVVSVFLKRRDIFIYNLKVIQTLHAMFLRHMYRRPNNI